MSIDKGTFENLVPSRFITFTFPNPSPSHPLHTPLLRVAVLDSPTQPTTTPQLAAMLVPTHRESDWTFSTHSGHLLLNSRHHISRLIVIGNLPSSTHPTPHYTRPIDIDRTVLSNIENALTPLLLALSPKSSFKHGLPEIPFLDYQDDLIRSVVVDICVGSCVGEMLIEDVELEGSGFRRRLRFKRMPNLIQTQVRIIPIDRSSDVGFFSLGDLGFGLDTGSLVQPYLAPMVASLSLIGSYLECRIRDGLRLKALCLGVGGGALLGFLDDQLGFEVVGVEADEVVLTVARKYFGLQESKSVSVCVGDGIRLVQQIAGQGKRPNFDCLSDCIVDKLHSKFDVIMVDLDSSDAGMGTMAPPLEFVEKSVIHAARLIISDHGIVVINVIPPSRSFYENLVHEFREFFAELYEIDVGNGENFVVIATVSPVGTDSSDCKNSFLTKLKLVTKGEYMDSIRKI
ncbi:hypothetical protein Vadar_013461 [Vaccinium darrowii]|uniref:Uncharacterized protein n=1 Tax=Vaccinium darrowii TaxID=229202 RepID=A0ACB7XQR9_9ERIC|nr:hypothetical protein Vadar_013461 [Vaccinium darrowii]